MKKHQVEFPKAKNSAIEIETVIEGFKENFKDEKRLRDQLSEPVSETA